MAISFQLLAGEVSNQILRNSEILSFPITGLMVGVLVTILVQSSSTSSSIFITMLAADILTLDNTIYMLMGANIGTTITNTIVALVQINDREDFSRAFAGATVHDMFNWLTVIILLPLEVVSGYLRRLSGVIVEAMNLKQYKEAKQDLLKAITKPLTEKIIVVSKKILRRIYLVIRIYINRYCFRLINPNCQTLIQIQLPYLSLNYAARRQMPLVPKNVRELLVILVVVLVLCLFGLVKILKMMLLSSATESAKKIINSEKLGFLKGYIAIILGTAMTILLQSSSVFTSALTPLVGTGFLSLELMFPLSLGSNIGTTVTGILAALAADNQSIQIAMQAAMVHLFFNISGILIWYPIPYCRAVPIFLAKKLGRSVTNHRWFAIVYILLLFVIVPGMLVGFAQIHWIISLVIALTIVVTAFLIGILTCIQHLKKQILPKALQNWKFLPKPMRSLDPYDKVFAKMQPCCKKLCFCCSFKKAETARPVATESVGGEVNRAYSISVPAVNLTDSVNESTDPSDDFTRL
ncbi:UNVERIFIED_CONTAM: hypothetical protein GTU68_000316 [Idotea baltica]|nr:hypothetical protein [Idotea baltica]